APAARGGPEGDPPPAGLEQGEFVVDLLELEGRTRAPSFAAGGGDVGVIELAREPALGGGRALAGGPQPHLELTPAAPGPSALAAHGPSSALPMAVPALAPVHPRFRHQRSKDALAQAAIGD